MENKTVHSWLRIGAALVMGIVTCGTAAYSQKVGYVASSAIIENLPQAQEVRKKLAEAQSTWLRDIQNQERAIAAQKEEIQINRLLWSSQERQEAEAKLQDAEGKLSLMRTTKFGPDGEYEKKYKEMMGPILDLVTAAIREEAKAQKYDYIFDKSSRGLPMLFANTDYDITVAVLKRLGVNIDRSTLEASAPIDTQPEGDAVQNRGNREEEGGRFKALDPRAVINDIQIRTPFGDGNPNELLDNATSDDEEEKANTEDVGDEGGDDAPEESNPN